MYLLFQIDVKVKMKIKNYTKIIVELLFVVFWPYNESQLDPMLV